MNYHLLRLGTKFNKNNKQILKQVLKVKVNVARASNF